MVAQIFGVITDAVSSFASTLATGVTALTGIVYDSTNGFSFVGTMLLIAVGMAIVYWIFRLIRGLTAGVAR